MSKAETMSKEEGKYQKGLEGVVAGETSLSLVDGQNSKLYYRGIPVHELVEGSHYEETVYLLWNNKLPLPGELKEFSDELKSLRDINPEIREAIIQQIPKTAHPMGVLRSLVSLLALYDDNADSVDAEDNARKAKKLVASFPTAIAAYHRYREGKEFIAPNNNLSHSANFYYMMQGEEPSPEQEKALDAYLILLADHGLNASTFCARVTTSTQSDMYSAITSAIGTLKGYLHGSANQKAMEMLMDIGTVEKADPYVRDLLAKKAKIMGFGHRIYKEKDPRAIPFREIARRMCESSGETKWMDISDIVEKIVWDEKKIPCNVDFYSASVLYLLGFPVDFFTTVFAASRVAGWSAHVIEQISNNRLIRPTATYLGPTEQHYVAMEQRK